jgi:hypothetical protein
MKRKIAQYNGAVVVEQIGNLHKYYDYYFFKAVTSIGRITISELTTGYGLPHNIKTWKSFYKFMKEIGKEKFESVMEKAQTEMNKLDILYPLNSL